MGRWRMCKLLIHRALSHGIFLPRHNRQYLRGVFDMLNMPWLWNPCSGFELCEELLPTIY